MYLYQNSNAISAFDTGFRNRIINGDGNIDQSLARPINIDEMKKEDVERLMLILDDLKRGDQ